MEDRKLLEAAAKVVGRALPDFVRADGTWEYHAPQTPPWNPLADDGDALRLAVKLQIVAGKYDAYASACALGNPFVEEIIVWAHEEKDPYAATRRAIVRAAAAMATEDA